MNVLGSSCHACGHVVEGRSAASYVGGVLVRLHPKCAVALTKKK